MIVVGFGGGILECIFRRCVCVCASQSTKKTAPASLRPPLHLSRLSLLHVADNLLLGLVRLGPCECSLLCFVEYDLTRSKSVVASLWYTTTLVQLGNLFASR